ncbi:MAG: Ig-like domain-containing protein, partial [Thermoleophilia bacterium]
MRIQNSTTKLLILCGLVVTATLFLRVQSASAATYSAASCSQADVQTAINAVQNEGTVAVPSGTCNWSSAISLPANKDLTVQGATVVTCSGSPITCTSQNITNIGCAVCFLFNITASQRITGFTMTAANSGGVAMVNNSRQNLSKHFRLDHNRIVSTSGWAPMELSGGDDGVHPQGLVDNNSFVDISVQANGTTWQLDENDAQHKIWAQQTPLGDSKNIIYIEDNHWQNTSGNINSSDSNYGGRYVFRFNNITSGRHTSEVHSVQGDNRGSQRTEIYHNSASGLSGFSGITFWRGGSGVLFGNRLPSGTSSFEILMDNVRSEKSVPVSGWCNGSSAWDQNTFGQSGWHCRDQIGTAYDVTQWDSTPTPLAYNQAFQPLYMWNNRTNGTQLMAVDNSALNTWILVNRDYYTEVASFTGATGVGMGPLSSRPSTCTTGVSYWATDQGEWNSNQAGPDGQLYKCTATNTWSLYYTPYTYPHPLQGAASTKFVLGDRVQVSSGPLNVRATPTTAGTLLGTQATGALGTVIGGPTAADGFNWWNINYDTGADGWSVEDFLVKIIADTTPPTVSLTAPAGGATVSSTITVSASASDNTGVVGVQFLVNGANLGAEDTISPYTVSWNTASSTNASHTLTARARDAAGNQTTSASITVTTSNVTVILDTTPPSTPTNLTATAISSSQINLSWTASTDNVAVAGYRVFRNGSQIATVASGTSYQNTGLSVSTAYTYTVSAYDAAGNNSAQSSSASATTQAQATNTITAVSCSQSAVQTAVNQAQNGYTVKVPAGDCTWADQVSITKDISVLGAGIGQTILRRNGTFFALNASKARISGFTFIGNGTLISFWGQGVRIDHNRFESTTFSAAVSADGNKPGNLADKHPEGVIDSNEFVNGRVLVSGDANLLAHTIWSQPTNLGSGEAVYVEDNTIYWNVFGNAIDANYGGKYVFRNNSVTWTDVNATGADAHSLQGNHRATRKWEIYNNTFNRPGAGGFVAIWPRGGPGVIFNNSINGNYSNAILFDNVRSQETWLSNPPGTCNGASPWDGNTPGQNGWPCRDQIGRGQDAWLWTAANPYPPQASEPVYVWGNTKDGNPVNPGIHNCGSGVKPNGSCADIQVGRDYIVDTPKPGYIPYTYPHPLRSSDTPPPTDTQAPSAPTGLTATAISSSQINLSWSASTDNVGVTGYKIYRGGTQIATVTTTSYQNTGLSPSTAYTYTVAAYDAAGNVSTQSTSVSATTQATTSTKFVVGDRVQVSSGPLNVRATPTTAGTLLGTQATGALGTIIGGPISADGFNWWNVNYDNAPDGWSAEDFLVKSTASTSTLLSAERSIDWSTVGIPGGIPNRTSICATINPGMTTAAIQTAIDNCPANSVVFFSAGTHNLTSSLTINKGVVLRGAGLSTKLVLSGNIIFSPNPGIGGLGGYPAGFTSATNWTSGYNKGDTVITVASSANLQVGQEIVLDQLNDTSIVNVTGNGGTCGVTANSCGR